MKIYINRGTNYGPYGGGAKFVNALYENAETFGYTIVQPNEADMLFAAGIDVDGNFPSLHTLIELSMYTKKPVALRVNDCDARKATNYLDKFLIEASKYVHTTVFVSHWMKNYFIERGWKCSNNHVIVNGVDHNLFKPAQKLNNGKVNVVTAHWSDNPMKTQGMNEFIDNLIGLHRDISFTYIGRTKAKLYNTTHIPPLPADKLGAVLAKYDVCINASMHDPAPNAVIESVSCGLPTYVSHLGGGCIELAGEDHVYKDFTEVRDLLLGRNFVQNSTKFDDWKTCVKKYVDLLM